MTGIGNSRSPVFLCAVKGTSAETAKCLIPDTSGSLNLLSNKINKLLKNALKYYKNCTRNIKEVWFLCK